MVFVFYSSVILEFHDLANMLSYVF